MTPTDPHPPATPAATPRCKKWLAGHVQCRLTDGHAGEHDFTHAWVAEFQNTSSCKLCGQCRSSGVHQAAPEVPEGGTGGGALFRQWCGNSYEWDALTDVERQRWHRLADSTETRLRAVTAERDEARRVLNGCAKHGNYNGHACIGCIETELATLRIAFGIEVMETIPEQEAKFGSILVDTAGSRRRVSPASENEERMAAELIAARAERDAAGTGGGYNMSDAISDWHGAPASDYRVVRWHNPDNLPSAGESPWRFLLIWEKVHEGCEVWDIRIPGWVESAAAIGCDLPTAFTYRTKRPLP